MAGSLVAARVDAKIKAQADYYIEQAGKTQADVIRAVWLTIAQTGEIPGLEAKAEKPAPLALRMRELRSRTPGSPFLENLTPAGLKEELENRG